MPKPTIGRIVWYRTDARNGLVYDLPAIITCTRDSHPGPQYPSGEPNPLPIPSSDSHVHLTVFTPGGRGTMIVTDETEGPRDPQDSTEFKGALRFVPGSGTYVELNVDQHVWPDGDAEERPVEPRTWRWPDRYDDDNPEVEK